MSFYRLFGFDEVIEQVQEEQFSPEGIFGHSQVMITTDPTHPGLRELQSNRQQVAYLVLPEEEIELGLVRPLRFSYQHVACGTVTRMGLAIAQTFARQPSFYTQTFCATCRAHFPLRTIPFKLSFLTSCEYAGGRHMWLFAKAFGRWLLRGARMFSVVA